MSFLTHSELDRFLLEIGVDAIKAGQDLGNKINRTNAIAQYTLAHQKDQTADGQPLALAVVCRAANSDPDYPAERYNVDQKARVAFWINLEQDGYALRDGGIVANVQTEPGVPPYAAAAAPEAAPSVSAPIRRSARMTTPGRQKVFIVHGRADGAKHEVARFLSHLELEPVILHERPNCGRTLISKFQEESADIHFAVVLMTPDDVGGLAGVAPQHPRARQNVIFELGFFIGKLGPGKVCALVAGEIEKPSSPGKNAVLHRTTARFTSSESWSSELRGHLPARPTRRRLRSGSCTSAHGFAPRFLPTFGRPHAVAVRFDQDDLLSAGLAPARQRPCWAHKKKPASELR